MFSCATFSSRSKFRFYSMGSIDNSMDFSSPSSQKAAIISQVQHEAAMANARQLISVRLALSDHPKCKTYLLISYPAENQLALLRKMRSVARKQPVKKRRKLFHAVYGKVHGHMEYCEQAVRWSNTKSRYKWIRRFSRSMRS